MDFRPHGLWGMLHGARPTLCRITNEDHFEYEYLVTENHALLTHPQHHSNTENVVDITSSGFGF